MSRSGLALRSACAEDVEAAFNLFAQVQSLHAEAEPDLFRPPDDHAAFAEFFFEVIEEPKQHLVFAELDDEVVGYVHFTVFDSPQDLFRPARCAAYVDQVVVADGHRRNGIASALLEHAKSRARELGASQLGIDCWSFNIAARECFENAGFELKRIGMRLDL